MKIVCWLLAGRVVPVRSAGGVSLLQTDRLPSPPAPRHPSDAGGSDRCEARVLTSSHFSLLQEASIVLLSWPLRDISVCVVHSSKRFLFILTYYLKLTNFLQSVLSRMAVYNPRSGFLFCIQYSKVSGV